MQLPEVVKYETSEVELKSINRKLEKMKSKHEELLKELQSKIEI